MSDSQRFSHIVVSSDEDDDIVVHAGAKSAPDEGRGTHSSADAAVPGGSVQPSSSPAGALDRAMQMSASPAADDDADCPADACAERRPEAAFPRAAQESAAASDSGASEGEAPVQPVVSERPPARERASSESDDDLGLEPMPAAQKIIIAAAVVGIVAFVAYFIFFM